MGVRSVNGLDASVLLPASIVRAPASRTGASEDTGKSTSEAGRIPSPGGRAERGASATQSDPARQATGTRLRIDGASKQVVAQIVTQSNEVIKQIPPEDVLKIAAQFRELCGKLFDETA